MLIVVIILFAHSHEKHSFDENEKNKSERRAKKDTYQKRQWMKWNKQQKKKEGIMTDNTDLPHSQIPGMISSRFRVALLISMHDDKAIRFY